MKLEQTKITEFIKDPSLFSYKAPSKIGKNRRWTDEEKQYLRDNWETKTAKEMARTLKRGVEAVRFTGLVRLGLNKRTVRAWTKQEVTYLKRYHSRMTREEIAEKLDRSLGSVATKCMILGLRKMDTPKYWSKDEVKIVKYMRKEGYPVKIISHVLSRTPESVSHKLSALNI